MCYILFKLQEITSNWQLILFGDKTYLKVTTLILQTDDNTDANLVTFTTKTVGKSRIKCMHGNLLK